MQARGEMILYYNPENGAPARQTALMKSVFVRMGVRIRNVRPEEVNETVGYLAGLKGFEKREADDSAGQKTGSEEALPKISEQVFSRDFPAGGWISSWRPCAGPACPKST